MGLCVLLSAMHLADMSILDELNIKCDAVVINQGDVQSEVYEEKGSRRLFCSVRERGLSKSRNMAMEKASLSFFEGDDICVFCDNDCVYEEDGAQKITKAFADHPGADIIVFFIKRPERETPFFKTERSLGYMGAMKVFSPEIAFRKESLKKVHLGMDERFGAGARFGMGEENIFLFDAIRLGLKVLYMPVQIAHLKETESTWFTGYGDRFFVDRGAGYRRMAPGLFPLLNLQFALRKRGLYKKDNTFAGAMKAMKKGAGIYRNGRIFVVGDYYSNTGPAKATARLIEALPHDVRIQHFKGRLLRLIELMFVLPTCGVVFLSGHSKQNLYAIRLARRFKKRVFFWMHGAVEHENRINRADDRGMSRVERDTLAGSDRILAVSPSFAGWLRENYPELAGRVEVLENGIEPGSLGIADFSRPGRAAAAGCRSGADRAGGEGEGAVLRLLAVGGGMIRKRIVRIAEAAQLLNERGLKCTLTVLGERGAESMLIDSFRCVKDAGRVSFEKTREYMRNCDIFIQNSSFETFGLAPLEALTEGANLLFSKNTGALCVFDEDALRPEDIIEDCENVREIADRISYLSAHPNNERLMAGIDLCAHSWRRSAGRLLELALEDQ